MASCSLLQGILELQKQAAVPQDPLASTQSAQHVCASPLRLAKRDHTSSELTIADLYVDIWHVLRVAKDGGIRHDDRVRDDASAYFRSDMHVLLQSFARIDRLDARLQR